MIKPTLVAKTTFETPGCASMDSLAPPVTKTAEEPGFAVRAAWRHSLEASPIPQIKHGVRVGPKGRAEVDVGPSAMICSRIIGNEKFTERVWTFKPGWGFGHAGGAGLCFRSKLDAGHRASEAREEFIKACGRGGHRRGPGGLYTVRMVAKQIMLGGIEGGVAVRCREGIG